MSKSPTEMHELLADLLDGELTDAQWNRLRTLMDGDEDARRLYRQTMIVESLLERFQGEIDSPELRPQPATADLVAKTRNFLTRPTPLSLTIATLVMGLLITGMAFMFPPVYRAITRGNGGAGVVTELPVVARVSGLHEVRWDTAATNWQFGARLQAGRELSINSGLVELTFDSGARALLEGPCEFIIETDNGGTLTDGRLTARVPRDAVGFTVQTPTAVIVDLGTEFGVVVTDSGTDVAVFQGQVEARSNDNNSRNTISIGRGQAYRLRPQDARPQPIELAVAEFETDLPRETRGSDPYVAAVLADRPVGYWRLNEQGTTAVINRVGRPHGSYHGDVSLGADARPGDAAGSSARFDGVDDYVEIKHRLGLNTDDFTLEAWVKLDHQPRGFGSVITSRDDVPNSAGYMLYISPTGRWEFWTGNGTEWSMLKGPSAEVGRWTHIAVSYQRMQTHPNGILSGIARIFVDGNLVAKQDEFTYRPLREYSRPLRMGAGASEQITPNYFFPGQIADVAIYDRALSGDEIKTRIDTIHVTPE